MKKTVIYKVLCILLVLIIFCGAVYQGLNNDITYISSMSKNRWKTPLLEILSDISNDYSEEEWSHLVSCAVGLLEIDFVTKTPELIVAYPGGSARNYTLTIISLETGEVMGETMTGWYDENAYGFWGTYLNTEDNTYHTVGFYNHRIGWQGRERMTSIIECDEENVSENNIFKTTTEHNINFPSYDENGKLVYDDTVTDTDIWFYLNGQIANREDYYDARESFALKYQFIPDTALQMYEWNDIGGTSKQERIEHMVEVLLSSEQKFIKL